MNEKNYEMIADYLKLNDANYKILQKTNTKLLQKIFMKKSVFSQLIRESIEDLNETEEEYYATILGW